MLKHPLNGRQRKLVLENMDLLEPVMRRVVCEPVSHRNREREDLVQEGYLGLIRAAQKFDARHGIAFRAYAIHRIQHAVVRALYERFSTVRVPFGTVGRRRVRGERSHDPRQVPQVHSLGDKFLARPDGDCHDPKNLSGDSCSGVVEVIRRVHRQAQQSNGRRGDRADLVDQLIRTRLLVPDGDLKKSLHKIAEETDSSYGRVTSCEKTLLKRIRKELLTDPRFQRYASRRKRDAPRMSCTSG